MKIPRRMIEIFFSLIFLFVGLPVVGVEGQEIRVEPVELKAQTPDLNIESSRKLMLMVGVVIPDPMSYTITYDLPRSYYHRDLTAEYRKGGFQLERELSKVSSETFSQAFNQLVVMRELPQPGQYDVVVLLRIGKISMIGRTVGIFKLACDVTTEWSLSVLDHQNKELSNKKGVSAARSFEWGAMSPGDWSIGMGHVMSATLTELAKGWGEFLYSSEELRGQTPNTQKNP